MSAEDTLNIKIEPVWGENDDSIQAEIHNGVLAGGTDGSMKWQRPLSGM